MNAHHYETLSTIKDIVPPYLHKVVIDLQGTNENLIEAVEDYLAKPSVEAMNHLTHCLRMSRIATGQQKPLK